MITGLVPAATDRAAEHGGAILRAYLLDLCQRRLALEVEGSLVDAVHADLAAWYGPLAAPNAVTASRRYICADDPEEHTKRFGRLVCHLIACGELCLASVGNNVNQAVILRKDGRVHISKWGLNECLSRRHAPALDCDAITTRLRAAGILLDEQEYTTWVVPECWLNQHMDDRRREDTVDSRVIT